MKLQEFARAAAVLGGALLAGGPAAQTVRPEPTMVDTAPTPAHDRSSMGAVILLDQPVLAQREALLQARERSGVDTRSLGAGPNRALRRAPTKEEIDFMRALDAVRRQGATPP